MSNIISYDAKEMDLVCSNGMMSVLMTVIGLSGSALAKQWYEKDLIVWLMEHDQRMIGLGMAGFELTELPWQEAYFAQQKQFLHETLGLAKTGFGWDKLDYTPNKELLLQKIEILQKMLGQMIYEDVNYDIIQEWYDVCDDGEPMKNGYPICQKHGILLSVYGCVACHDI